VEGIRLWRANRQKLVGIVYLDKGILDLDIQDDHERALVEDVLEQTGQVTWSSVGSTKASGRRTSLSLAPSAGSGLWWRTSCTRWVPDRLGH
jgi:hypothetical protein